MLVETFIEEKNESRMENCLPTNYHWKWTAANRDKELGRPWGGELIGVRKEINYSNPWQDQIKCCNGINILINGKDYNLTNVYNRTGVKHIKKLISDRVEENINKRCIVFGDWNARIGDLGHRATAIDATFKRKSMDTVCNDEGLDMLELMDDCGLSIMNGNKSGDWQGCVTHVGYRSQSVIDYGAANELAWEDITEFRVGDEHLSDHFPLEVTLAEEVQTVDAPTHKWIQKFDANDIVEYQKRLVESRVGHSRSWKELAKGMADATVKKRVRIEKENPWWNSECYEARVETKRERRRANSTGEFSTYHAARKRYKVVILESKKIHQERILNEIKEVKDIRDAWRYINRKRKVKLFQMTTN